MWNFRVVKKTLRDHSEIGIYSVYYDLDGEPNGVSMDPQYVMGYSVEDLADTLRLMEECLDKPVLNWEDIVHEP